MVGLYFTIPAGWSNDTLGPFPTCMASSLLAAGGYLLASFAAAPSFWALGLGLALTGFGSGGMFISVLASVIKSRPNHTGSGIGLVGACMSLSMAFTSVLIMSYDAASGCKGDPCWRAHLRFLAAACGAVLIPGAFVVRQLTDHGGAPEESFAALDGVDAAARKPLASAGGSQTHTDGGDDNHRAGGRYAEPGLAINSGSGGRTVYAQPTTPQTPRLTGYRPPVEAPGLLLEADAGELPGASAAGPRNNFGETPQRVAFLDLDAAPSPIRGGDDDGDDGDGQRQRGSLDSAGSELGGIVVEGLGDHVGGADPRDRDDVASETSLASDRRRPELAYSQSAHASTVHSMMVSLRVFRHPYFWALFLTYFAGIGAGIIIIAS
jgi:hypothetical protein